MSETQRYKLAKEFTVPTVAVPYLRRMIRSRLDVVQKAVNDRDAVSCFSLDETSALMVECLTLAKLLQDMPADEVDHA